MATWEFIGATYEESFEIEGVDVFKHKWKRCGNLMADVVIPRTGGRRGIENIYEIETSDGKCVRFAAGEVSNGCFAFYIPPKNDAGVN